jgi:hypothetical protein
MRYRKLLVINPNPKKGNGEYIKFADAKDNKNKVDLKSYNHVFLDFSMN